MEFIKRSAEPDYLLKNKEKWTKPWIDFYLKKRDENGDIIREKKPSDDHWTKDKIRKILISDFKNNCGYCGCSRPTPRSSTKKETSPRGHVDHYRAKAIYPHLTYKWSNYIWSCESCNVEKGEFDDPNYPILNPCQLTDCTLLEFKIDSGKYCLRNNQKPYDLRYLHTDQSTMLNASEIAIRRRNRIKMLTSLFETTSILLEHSYLPSINGVINQNINNILEDLEDLEFYFLMTNHYQYLRNQHSIIAVLIDNINLQPIPAKTLPLAIEKHS
jgi:uncharacterized protein (TIGR02646 family)